MTRPGEEQDFPHEEPCAHECVDTLARADFLVPEQVVGLQLSETLRSHTDLQTDQPNAKYTREALKYPQQPRAGACAVVDSTSRSFLTWFNEAFKLVG